MYTLGEAAKATGKGKTTIQKAIKSGKISATKDAFGRYQIDPAELHRVYKERVPQKQNGHPQDPYVNTVETASLRAELDVMKRLVDDRQKTIDDLRSRLDQEAKERQALTHRLVEYQQPKGFWKRIFGG